MSDYIKKLEFSALCDDGNYTPWRKEFDQRVSRFNLAGKALLINKKLYPRAPRYTDMILDENGNSTGIQKYEHTAAIYNGEGEVITQWKFTPEGLKDFKRASNAFPLEVAQFSIGNDKLADFIITHLGSDVKKELYAHPLFIAALHAEITDTFAMLQIISDLYSKGTSKTTIRMFQKFLSITQGDLSHAAYMELIKDNLEITRANFESPEFPGKMDLNLMGVIIYLGGLNMTHFQAKYDSFIAANPSSTLDKIDLQTAMLEFNMFYREKETSPLNYASTFMAEADAKLPAVAAVASTPSGTSKCVTCSGPTTINPITGKSYSFCLPCNRDRMSKKRGQGAKPGPLVAKPTPAQLLAARAMVTAADAAPSPAQALSIARAMVAAADSPPGLQAGPRFSAEENPFEY